MVVRVPALLILASLLLLNVVVATPDGPADATLTIVSGTSGGYGWYRTPVGMDFNAHGRVANGSYAPIQSLDVVRDGAAHGHATYVDEFETAAAWNGSSLQGAADPTLHADGTLVQQGFASLNVTAVQPADAHDHQAKVTRAASLNLSAYDTAKLAIRYDTSHSGYLVGGVYVGRDGNVTLKLFDGAQTTLSQTIELSPGVWNQVTLNLSAMTSPNVTAIEVDIDSPRATYALTSSETQWFNLDGFRAFAKADLVESSEGDHLWHVRVNDSAGSTDAADVHVRVDMTAPTTNASINGTLGQNGWYVSSTKVLFNGSDALSGYQSTRCTINGGSLMNCPGYVLIPASDGAYTVSYWGYDYAGNQETHQSIVVRQDRNAPNFGYTRTSTGTCFPNGWCNGNVTLAISASDGASGLANVSYRVNGGAWTTTANGTTTLSFATDGWYNVEGYAVDNAGNALSTRTYSFGVDKTRPVVDSYSPNATACPSDIVAALYHDATSGVDANGTTLRVEQHVGTAPADRWVDVTSAGTIHKDGSSITWTSTGPMAVGDYRATVNVQDNAANVAALQWGFTVGLYSYC